MIACYVETLIARILSQGASRKGDLDDEFSLYFAVVTRNGEITFTIPRPLADGGYTAQHLEVIELQLASVGLELLPLDPNLTSN